MTVIEDVAGVGPAFVASSWSDDWVVDPASGWSREELEGLLAAGVRVIESGDEPAVAEAGGGWLEELEHPGHGPVALWHRLEAFCAAGKRRAAAELARRDALAGGLAHLEGHDVLVGEVSIAADELALRIGVTRPAARRLVASGRA